MRAYLEITNICNRTCSFCPGTHRVKRFATPAEIAHRLDQLHGIEELYLHVLGEPLLHPQFRTIAELCRVKGIPVNLTTNGTLLTPEKADMLLNNPIFRQVNFSLQALTPQELPVLDNILDFAIRAGEQRPDLYVNLRLWNLTGDYVLPGQNRIFLDRICRRLALPPLENPFPDKKHRSLCLKGRIYLHGNTVFEWPVRRTDIREGHAFCYGLSRQFAILVDGSVVPCCLDSEGEVTLGNADRERLDVILGGVRACAIRAGFRDGNAVENLCRRCSFRETVRRF